MSPRTRWTLALACLLAVGLAGCLGGDPPIEESEASPQSVDEERDRNASEAQEAFPDVAEPSSEDADAEETADPSVLTYENLEGPFQATFTQEGSFQAHEACFPVGCPASVATGDQVYLDRVEITDQIPANVPVRYSATVTYDGQVWSYMTVDAATEEGTLYQAETADDFGEASASGIAVREPSGTVEILVFASQADPPEQSYELEVQLEADPAEVPATVPVAVDVDDPPLLVAGSGDQAASPVRAWGPDEALAGEVETLAASEAWNASAETGEHVVAAGEGELRLAVPAEEPSDMRALTLAREYGEPHTLGPEGQVAWEAEVDRVPYGAGAYILYEAPTVHENLVVTVSTPEGQLAGFDGWTSITVGPQDFVTDTLSDPVDENLVAGTWTGEADARVNTDTSVGHLLWTVNR